MALLHNRDIVNQRPNDSACATKLSRIEDQLAVIEVEHSISSRWLPGTIEYSTVRSSSEIIKREICDSRKVSATRSGEVVFASLESQVCRNCNFAALII